METTPATPTPRTRRHDPNVSPSPTPRCCTMMWAILLGIMTGTVALMLFSAAIVSFMMPTTPTVVKPAVSARSVKKAVVKSAPAPLPVRQAPSVQAPTARINIDISTPAGSRVKVDVVEDGVVIVPAPTPTPPVPQQPVVPSFVPPSPPVPVQPPMNPPPPTREEPIQAPFAPVPAPNRNVGSAGGFTLQFNVFTNGGWLGGPAYYGSTYYGWTPGRVARVCEPRSTGTICFDRWIANPHPSY